MRLKQQSRSEQTLRLVGLVACGLLLFLCGFAICPPTPVMETSATAGDAKAATNSVKLSIGDGGTLSFDLKPFSADGTFAESSEMTILASTDSYSGYTLSISAQSGDNTTKLINTDTVNCLVTETKCSIAPLPSTLNGGILKSDYVDPASSEDVNVSVNTVRNTWGFNPSTYLNGNTQMSNRGEGVDEKYFPVSTAETNFAKTSTANLTDTETGDLIPQEYTMKIGARVDTTIPMGTYQNDTFVIKAVGNGASYTINYVDSSGQANPSSMPANQVDLTTYETTVALRTNTPTRSGGYYFAGWCSANTTTTDCNGSIYKPGDNFGIDQTSNDNTITLYAMWTDCQSGRICYDDNGANSVTKMGDQNIGTSATEATLWASNFQRSGYGFLGWSTKPNPVIGTDTIYGPMETISNINVSQGGIKLYAVWKAAETTTVGETTTPVYLQDWNGCNNLTAATYNSTTGKITVTQNSFIALTDKRDDQVYAIAKLADGACWMIENLRLDTAGTVGNNKHDNSITNQSLAQGYGDVFAGLANPETANFSNSDVANSLYYIGTQSGTATININQNYSTNSNYRMPRYRNNNTVLAEGETDTTTGNSVDTYAYGNYYTWAAAIANTMHYTSYSASDAAGTSICPSGWRLPMGGRKASVNNSDFWKLSRANIGTDPNNFANDYFYYTGNPEGVDASRALRSFPNNFLYSGRASNSSVSDRGSNGYYWSSSANNANYAYNLNLDSSDLRPGTSSYNKYGGFAVRCVAGS